MSADCPGAHPTSQKLAGARFYAVLDAADLAPAQFAPMCRAMLAGGADIVQIRAKGLGADDFSAILESILPQFETVDTPLIVNEFLEIALKYPRCGLHIGPDDVSILHARTELGPDRILGLTTHTEEQAAKALEMAGLLSYFCIGPVYPSRTRPEHNAIGPDTLRAVCRMNKAGNLPLFCFGGITRDNIGEACRNGARRVMAVSEVLHDADPENTVRELRATIGEPV